MEEALIIGNDEFVARILSAEWFLDGILLAHAFTLREKETYISVNRLSISSYASDVRSFVEQHPTFLFPQHSYKRALLSVADIRSINVEIGGKRLNVNVEVEPRSMLTKSHAGIFTRLGNRNIKKGITDNDFVKGVSANDILLEVRAQLVVLSSVEQCSFG